MYQVSMYESLYSPSSPPPASFAMAKVAGGGNSARFCIRTLKLETSILLYENGLYIKNWSLSSSRTKNRLLQVTGSSLYYLRISTMVDNLTNIQNWDYRLNTIIVLNLKDINPEGFVPIIYFDGFPPPATFAMAKLAGGGNSARFCIHTLKFDI